MNIPSKKQDSISDNVDPERGRMAYISCRDEDIKEYVEQNSSSKRRPERHQHSYPDAFDIRKKGAFACLVCFKRFTSCLKVKRHFIQEHPKAFCALGHENVAEPRIQAKLLLFCPKNCHYVTLNMNAFTHHLATCLEPDLSLQDYVGNQMDFMAEYDDEDDGQDRQVENRRVLASKLDQCTKVIGQEKGPKVKPVGKFTEVHTCKRCNAKFSSSHFLECHMKLHHNEKSRAAMQSHKNVLPPYCPQKYENMKPASVRSKWQAEANKKGNGPDYLRPSCSRIDKVHKTFGEDSVLRHSSRLPLRLSRQIRSKARFTCRKCSMNFNQIQNFHKHMVMHEKEKHANRAVYGKIKSEKESLTSPVRNIASEQNKISAGNSQRLLLNRVPLFECVRCKKCFHHNKALILHMRSHRAKLHQCCECGKTFKRSHCLSVHMRTHTGERPCKCEECGLSFRTSGTLRMHLKRHRGDRPFQCAVCGNSFGSRSTLQTHFRTHTGEKPYQCAECGKSFSQSGSLNLHMRIHTGEKPFKCEMCDRAFIIRAVLRKHMRTHTKEKPYKCGECGKEFSNVGCFKFHLRSHQKKKK